MTELFRMKIVAKRQLTVPQRLMDALGLSQGDEIQIELADGRLRLRPYRVTPADEMSPDAVSAIAAAKKQLGQRGVQVGTPDEFFGPAPQPSPLDQEARPESAAADESQWSPVAGAEPSVATRPEAGVYREYLGRASRRRRYRWTSPYQSLDNFARRPEARIAPRNFRRDDANIYDSVGEALSEAGLDVSDVEIEVAGGVVTLSGSVPARSERLAAEDIASRVLGVRDVVNHIQVRSSVETLENRIDLDSPDIQAIE